MTDLERPRILCIEDDVGAAQLLKRRLSKAGYDVDLAFDGEEGLAAWETGSYHLLAVDQDMPRMTGIELIRAIASRGDLPPTVMITGAGSESIAVEAMKLGAEDYIIKDPGARYLDLIASVIDQALTRQRLLEDKRLAEMELHRSQRLVSVRDQISRVFLTIADREMYGEVLDLILEVFQSTLGLFGYLEEDGTLVWPSVTRRVWDGCQMLRKDFVLPSDAWGEVFTAVIRAKQPICINQSVPVPAGHNSVKRILGVPLVHRKEVIGLVVVANKEADYDEEDRELLESIGAHIAPVLHARLQREREEAQRRKTEQALRESEHMLQTILGTSPVGICLEENRKIIWVNDAYRELFGFDVSEDIAGKDSRFLYASEEDYLRTESMYDELEGASAKAADVKWRRKDGSVFDGHLMVRTVDPGNIGAGIICVLTDITWRKRAERFILQSERLKAIGELAGGVAHNFNNLLQVILGSANLGLTKLTIGDHAGAKNNLEEIVRSSRSGAQTVKRLQNFARVRTDDATGRRVFDLSSIVKDAIEMSKVWWKTGPEKEGIPIALNTRFARSCLVTGNENEMFEVVVNLIKNAVEALPQGGEIFVQTETSDDQVILSIKDDGLGINEEDQHKIFDPFWTTKDFERTGMGLATCYGIVQRHGGTISVQSQPRNGTKISVKLPLAMETSTTLPFDIVRPAKTPLSVLVVDDLPAVVKQLGSGLERLGHSVVSATTGKQALDIFKEVKIDLVICDLGMPAMNGWQVGASIKEICCERNIPKPSFVMLTGWSGQIYQSEKMEECGVDRVLEKPVDLRQLLDVVHDLGDR